MSKARTFSGRSMLRHNEFKVGRIRALLCLLSVPLIFNTAGLVRLQGQAATATVLGTVTDASGAAIADAAVQAKNTGTGALQTVASDSQGRFRLAELGIGTYDIQAAKTGFSTVVHNTVTLNVGSEVVVECGRNLNR